MWPLPTIVPNIVSITLRADSLVCSSITSGKQQHPYCLTAYRSIALSSLECHEAILYNPSRIRQHIQKFLADYNLAHSWTCLSIAGTTVIEKIVHMSSAHPEPHHFNSLSLKKMAWDYRYLYPSDNAHFAFYVCGIPRHTLAQYQLLTLSTQLNPLIITTEWLALLRLYKQRYGNAFRSTQLAKDMLMHNNVIEKLCSLDMVRRLVFIPSMRHLDLEKEYTTLTTALGLFLLGKDLGGTN